MFAGERVGSGACAFDQRGVALRADDGDGRGRLVEDGVRLEAEKPPRSRYAVAR